MVLPEWISIIFLSFMMQTSPDPDFSKVNYTKSEFRCLAKNIYFEARNQSLEGQLAVLFVTMNRVEHFDYPDEICDVVYQRKQFSWYSDGFSDNPNNKAYWKQSRAITRLFLENRYYIKDMTEGGMHYHADYVWPKWRHDFKKVAKIGDHIFYKVKQTNKKN